ncbi:tyrosine-type recombinase/integrase [Cupriavidus metallidurans]
MGTITPRKRADGSTGYMARVRIMRDGREVHKETQTFDRKQAADAWIKRRETELSEPGALDLAGRPDPTLGQIITKYLDETGAVKPLGRTKKATLKSIAGSDLGKLPGSQVDSAVLVSYARRRIHEDGVLPQTVNNDLVLLGPVFAVAGPAWGYRLDKSAMDDAKAVANSMGFVQHSQERTRVPTMDELNRVMQHFHDAQRRRKWMTPMLKLVAFAIFSTRRQEEIVRVRWEDLNEADSTLLVRDVKHPKKKIGNHQEMRLTPEALAIIQSMPRTDERIFPYTTDAVCAQFFRAIAWLEIEDLHFHDLRRAGVTRLFEMGWNIPDVAKVSLHKDWNMLRRYTNMKTPGDRYADWKWKQIAIDQPVYPPRPKRRAAKGAE